MANILMVNLPYAGHTNPTLPLAEALVQRGHHVSYINAPEWREKIEATGAQLIPYINYPENPTNQQKKMRCMLAAYKTVMAVGHGFDLLIYEMLFFPGKTAADRLGIPSVRQFSQPAWNEATVEYMMKQSRLWKMSCRLINLQMFTRSTAKAMDMAGKSLESVLSDVPSLNLVYLTEQFQPCRETFDERFFFVGPSFDGATVNGSSFSYGSMTRPLIYISLGTIISNRIFCRRCIKAFRNIECTVILVTGRIEPASLGDIPSHIHALSFAPQKEILAHADLFITHGGMNSVSEAIALGTPMLVMPILNDQPLNAQRVKELGIGKTIRPFLINAGMLQRAVLSVLGNDAIKKNCSAMKREVGTCYNISKAVERIENDFF